jgi:hypothetical protein
MRQRKRSEMNAVVMRGVRARTRATAQAMRSTPEVKAVAGGNIESDREMGRDSAIASPESSTTLHSTTSLVITPPQLHTHPHPTSTPISALSSSITASGQ